MAVHIFSKPKPQGDNPPNGVIPVLDNQELNTEIHVNGWVVRDITGAKVASRGFGHHQPKGSDNDKRLWYMGDVQKFLDQYYPTTKTLQLELPSLVESS
ncbi:MAG: hypothetical protein OEX12_15045 [Gammaproteobacteria bacterium]|nr:hypothetical protein [Gammaproteobacteria bacterium]